MKGDFGDVYVLTLASKNMFAHVETPLFMQPPPEGFDDGVMNTFQKYCGRIDSWIYVRSKSISGFD
jgi:hypothetical protein